jgi:prepilin-type N-terminal cleavage/methylation domain-containing protein
MRRIARSTSRPGEEGFTLLETLVGMVILSALAVGAWTATTVAWRSVARFRESARSGVRLLQLDDRLRDCAARVRPPWWGVEPCIAAAGLTWSISCLDGDPAAALTLACRDGVLWIDDGTRVSRHPGFSSVALSPALDEAGAPFGIELGFEAERFGRIAIIARFGGRVVRGGKP